MDDQTLTKLTPAFDLTFLAKVFGNTDMSTSDTGIFKPSSFAMGSVRVDNVGVVVPDWGRNCISSSFEMDESERVGLDRAVE